MKVRDLITALTSVPMDDEAAVRIQLGDQVSDYEIQGVRRVNADGDPHAVIDLAEPPVFTVRLVT